MVCGWIVVWNCSPVRLIQRTGLERVGGGHPDRTNWYAEGKPGLQVSNRFIVGEL